jgi:hypothetical protein
MNRPLVLALAAALAVPFVQVQVDRQRLGLDEADAALVLWRGAQVKRLFAGFEAISADLYWLRTVQYFGSQRLFASRTNFALLEPLIEITTTLDPRFEIAYRYGAIFLCEPQPGGAGRVDEGLEVLAAGVRALPESWRLRQDLGFFTYLYGRDAQRAASILSEAAKVKDAPYWLEGMAADILAEGGHRANARQMWARMYEQSEGGVIRENAKLRLQILDAEDTAAQLELLVTEYARRFGRWPTRLGQLREVGPSPPLSDPSGTAFEYDGERGRVTVSPKSPLWRPRREQEGQ